MTIPKRRFAPDVYFDLMKPPHIGVCSACHHTRPGEPFIRRRARYATGRRVLECFCPYCIFEWEAASIICKAYPRVYEMYRDGMYHRVKLVPQLSLFTGKVGLHEI
jgi:hypothetical protein